MLYANIVSKYVLRLRFQIARSKIEFTILTIPMKYQKFMLSVILYNHHHKTIQSRSDYVLDKIGAILIFAI